MVWPVGADEQLAAGTVVETETVPVDVQLGLLLGEWSSGQGWKNAGSPGGGEKIRIRKFFRLNANIVLSRIVLARFYCSIDSII